MKQKFERRDVQQEINDLFIAYIEENKSLPYVKEWNPDACTKVLPPHNPITGTVYSGTNLWTLGLSKDAILTDDWRFITFAQAKDRGWHVKRDSKSLPVVYSAPIVATNSDGDDRPVSDDRPSGRFLGRFSRYWRVFHASMIDGMPPLERPVTEPVAWTVPAGVQKILDNCGVEITEKGDKAFYSRRTKAVTVPERSSFLGDSDIVKAANFCAVSLHEVFHAMEDRLGLVKPSKFGDEEYSKGELRVEIAAAMACRYYSLPTNTSNQAGYVAGWLKNLRADKTALSTAMREAGMIYEALMSFDPEYKPAHTDDHEDAPTALDAVLSASSLPSAQPAP